MNDWYGNKPTRAVPLTDTFIRACLKTGALTPPPSEDRMTLSELGYVGVIGFAGVACSLLWIIFWR